MSRLVEHSAVATAQLSLTSAARRHWQLIALAVLLVVPLVVTQPYYREMLILVFLWGAMAGAWNIVGGYAGKFSLGHAAFFGIGAYTSSLLYINLGISPWLGLLAGVALATLFALFIGIVTLRLRGKFFALCTIAFAEVLQILAVYFRGLTHGSEGLQIPFRPGLANFMFSDKIVYVYLFLALMLAVYAIARWLDRSKLGYELIALREDEDAAEALGVNTLRAKLASTCLSAALTAAGGTFYAQYFNWIEPAYVFSLDLSVQFALYAIIGGMGTAIGPILGAALMTPLQLILRASLGTATSGIYLVVYGLALILVVLFMPKGLAIEIAERYQRWARRRARTVLREVHHVA